MNAIGLTSYAEKDHKDVKAAEEGKKVIQQGIFNYFQISLRKERKRE